MAKNQPTGPVESPVQVRQEAKDLEQDITLTEFCLRLSTTDRRVELIGAFHHDESKSGRIKDSESKFRSRFGAFVNKPA